jgi:1-acyl-sn-glycerol-3-phosphate acyltransferase
MNHISYLDFALAGVPFWYSHHRLVRFMAKKEVFDHPVSGPLMRGMKHIPVDRSAGAGAYRAAVEALRRGELIGVFPEATISRSWCLKEFKNGAVRMAQEAGVPVIPVILWGSHRVLTKGRPRNLRAARGTEVSITVGEPIPVAADADITVATKDLAESMALLLDDAQRRYHADPAGAPWWLPARMGGSAPTLAEAAALDATEVAARATRRNG